MLPVELFRRLRARTTGQGEPRLALAVLEEAIRCIERNHDAKKFLPRLFSWEAEQWIESPDRDEVFSFENVCATLGLDPEEIRGRVKARIKRRPTWLSSPRST